MPPEERGSEWAWMAVDEDEEKELESAVRGEEWFTGNEDGAE